MARFSKLTIIFCGQSQCLMAYNGNGEMNDANISELGAARLDRRLTALLPGCDVLCTGGTDQTYASSVPLFEEFGLPSEYNSFYIGSPFSNKTFGTAQRSFITGMKDADAGCVLLMFCQSQDAQVSAIDADGLYMACVSNYVAALAGDNSTGWADFAILPVLASARGGGSSNNARQNIYRRAWATLAGEDNFQGGERHSAVLRPVYNVAHISPAEFSGGGDFTHIIRSAAQRYIDAAAIRIGGWAGGAPLHRDQPRLSRAVALNSSTIRLYIAIGRRGARLVTQFESASKGFALSQGSISASSTVNNSASRATGYATIDLTASGFNNTTRVTFLTGLAAAYFGSDSPRTVLNYASAKLPTVGLSHVTDNAEDLKLPEDQWFVPMANCDVGVPVEFI